MIRPTIPEDTSTLVAITRDTGLFLPFELQALDEVFEDYFKEEYEQGHRCVTIEQDGRLIGFTYYAPADLTDRAWQLWWIVVDKQIQARGIGGQLLRFVEDAIRRQQGRMLFIETSGLPIYDLTRRFYVKHGYDVAATLKDFYADGNDMVVFSKRLS